MERAAFQQRTLADYYACKVGWALRLQVGQDIMKNRILEKLLQQHKLRSPTLVNNKTSPIPAAHVVGTAQRDVSRKKKQSSLAPHSNIRTSGTGYKNQSFVYN